MNDEIAYSLFLLFSIAAGFFIHRVRSSIWRKNACALIGFCSSIFFCKYDFLYALFSIVGCAIICCLDVKIIRFYRRGLLFTWAFSFLTFFRVANYFELPVPCALANAVQLVLTLKIVGIGGEIYETYTRRNLEKKVIVNESVDSFLARPNSQLELQSLYRDVHPSFIDVICYLYSYAGLFTGPYYSYRTWSDAMEGVPATAKTCSLSLYCRKAILSMLLQTSLCALLYFLLIKLFPLEYLWSFDWSMTNFVYRLLYLIPVFTWFRLRFYSAWLASEAACASLRIGVYPSIARPEPGAGPTDLVALYRAFHADSESDHGRSQERCFCNDSQCLFWSTDTVHNIAIYSCEFAPTIAEKLRAWNRTVQYWLAVNVYQRFPRSWPRPLRAFITVFVSAYWHGLHAGYYLSFGTAGAFLSAERIIPRLNSLICSYLPLQRAVPRSPEKEKPDLFIRFGTIVGNWFSGFWSMRVFEYMAVGFYALSFRHTTQIWADLFFAHHICIVILFVASFVLPSPVRKLPKD